MTQVETVGLWLGIFVGMAGIVLSLVAISFAVLVNKRSTQINDQTIESLMKIETTVLRLSEDTTGLIKAAWDKLLGQVGQRPSTEERSAAQALASGISAEIQARLARGANQDQRRVGDDTLERLLHDLEATIAGQFTASASERPADAIDRVLTALNAMSPAAQQLARSIAAAHLTLDQYSGIAASSLTSALVELRAGGIVVPLTGAGDQNGQDVPVYWFPEGQARTMVAALHVLPEAEGDVRAKVVEELKRVGYYGDEEGEEDAHGEGP